MNHALVCCRHGLRHRAATSHPPPDDPIKEPIASFSRFIVAGKRPASIEEKKMKFRMIAAAGLVAAFVAPALAADEFYVVQDVKTKKCTIVDKKPVDTSMTVVSPSGTIYKTRAEAETGMKTVQVCSSN
jgi:hypothetical protein